MKRKEANVVAPKQKKQDSLEGIILGDRENLDVKRKICELTFAIFDIDARWRQANEPGSGEISFSEWQPGNKPDKGPEFRQAKALTIKERSLLSARNSKLIPPPESIINTIEQMLKDEVDDMALDSSPEDRLKIMLEVRERVYSFFPDNGDTLL